MADNRNYSSVRISPKYLKLIKQEKSKSKLSIKAIIEMALDKMIAGDRNEVN